MAKTGNKPKKSRNEDKLWAVIVSLLGLALILLLTPDEIFTANAAQIPAATPAPIAPCPPGASNCFVGPVGSPSPLVGGATVTPSLVKAADSKIKMTVEAGIGPESYARGGSWIPVYINLENGGENTRGELVITVAPSTDTNNYQKAIQQYSSLYVQPAEMPGGARKRFVMYLPYVGNDLFNRTVAVEYNGTTGNESQPQNLALATAELKPLLNQLLVGYLASAPEALRGYDDITLSNSQNSNNFGKGAPPKHLRFTQLDPLHLPAISQALGSLNVLVLQDFDASGLSSGQWEAIESWVRQGGVLLLSGGTGASRVLKNLPLNLQPAALPTPADITELDPASLQALEKIGGSSLPAGVAGAKSYVVRLKLNPEASTLIGGENTPSVALELKRGAGAVILTAFDLAEPRFANWDGSPELWETLIGPYQNAIQQYGPYSAYGINSSNLLGGGLSGVLTNIPGISIPSLKIIGVLALIYIVVVGPLNYLILKRLKRLEFSWLTLPLLTVLFTGGIYLFALKDKGSELLTSSVSIVRLSQNDNQAKNALEKPALSLIGLFTPNDNNYLLGLPANSLSSAIPNYTYFQPAQPLLQPGQPASTPIPLNLPPSPIGLRLIQGNQPQVELLNMAQWSFRSIVAEGNVKLNGGLNGQFIQSDNKLKGTLTNNTGRNLTDVSVLTAFGLARLGDLATGQSVAVELDNAFGAPSPLFSLYQSGAATFKSGNSPPINLSSKDRVQARKRDLLNSLSGTLPLNSPGGYNPSYRPQSGNGIIALGWSEQPLLDYTVNNRNIGGNDLTLLVADLSLDSSRSTQILPGQILGKVSEKVSLPVAAPAAPNPAGGNGNGGGYLPPAPLSGASLEAGSVTIDFNLAGLAQTLQSGKKLKKLIIEAPAYAFNRNGYGPQQAPKYMAELYNYRTAQWEAVPVVLAPTACLNQAPAYSGGPVNTPLIGLNQPGAGANQNCQNAFGRPGLNQFTATPAPVQPNRNNANPTTTLNPTSGLTATPGGNAPTATPPAPTLPAYFPGGPSDSFIILQSGPNFDPIQYLAPDGTFRARYSRDAKNTDIVLWNYFSVGYEIS